jgi:hypothetical protein
LIRDFDKEEKNPRDLGLVICWDIGSEYRKNYHLAPYMVGQEGGTRENFGSTHALFVGVGKATKVCEVLCLSDFISYYEDPQTSIAKQAAMYV